MIQTIPIEFIPMEVEGELKVTYDESSPDSPVTVEVVSDSDFLISRVMLYFEKKRKYLIPVSQRIDDYREDSAKPIDNIMYFELALSEMESRIGVSWYFEPDIDETDDF